MANENTYEMCAYCNQGEHKLRAVNSWRLGNGFTKPFSLRKSFKGNFFGATLRYVTVKANIPPLVTYKRLANGSDVVGGSGMSLLIVASQYMNFMYNCSYVTYAGSLVNGSWTGGLGKILRNSIKHYVMMGLNQS